MTNRSVHILIVDDDPAMCVLMGSYMEKAGYRVSTAHTSAVFYSKLEEGQVNLILLDLNLPDGDGMEIARHLRRKMDIPIIMVTARDQDSDRIAGLELGVDDYLVKPFHPRELVARVRNLLHRVENKSVDREKADTIYTFAGFTMDLQRRHLFDKENQPVTLTRGEFDLLASLVMAAGRVLSRDQLIDAVSRRSDPPLERTIDVMISRLRHKLASEPPKSDLLVTVPGEGYQFVS